MSGPKDYYRVLNIASSATTEEIKRAFRRLALQYHPDKNHTALATERFTEIQEAYNILSNHNKRAAYNYQRYTQNPQRVSKQVASSAEEVLHFSIKIHGEVARMDPFRMDRDLLFFEISDILSVHNLELLRNTDGFTISREIIHNITEALHPLDFNHILIVIEKLRILTEKDLSAQKELQQFVRNAKQSHYWNFYKIYIALAAAVLFCLLILLTGKK